MMMLCFCQLEKVEVGRGVLIGGRITSVHIVANYLHRKVIWVMIETVNVDSDLIGVGVRNGCWHDSFLSGWHLNRKDYRQTHIDISLAQADGMIMFCDLDPIFKVLERIDYWLCLEHFDRFWLSLIDYIIRRSTQWFAFGDHDFIFKVSIASFQKNHIGGNDLMGGHFFPLKNQYSIICIYVFPKPQLEIISEKL